MTDDGLKNALPALFSNYFNVDTRQAPIMRLTFGDAIEGTDAVFHTTIVMNMANAMELADTINDLVTKMKVASEK